MSKSRKLAIRWLVLSTALSLMACATTSSTRLLTEPSGATVLIEGVDVGRTPYLHRDSFPRSFELHVEFKKGGYKPLSTSIRKEEFNPLFLLLGGFIIFSSPFEYAEKYTYILEPTREEWEEGFVPVSVAHAGMTWRVKKQEDSYVLVGSDEQTDPYGGDTASNTLLPILCIKQDGQPAPSEISIDSYNGWAAGEVRVTPPVLGSALTSLSTANSFCTKAFGTGYRMAEFHDGGGAWNWWAKGAIETTSRFWVRINNQPANPWD